MTRITGEEMKESEGGLVSQADRREQFKLPARSLCQLLKEDLLGKYSFGNLLSWA